jgi:hypothetical protein
MPITTRTIKMPQPCVAPCPACGGLQCLCRPRFFAGQLLTEEDLNRLERYIVEKNKLHNRYLQGWGVVCGLEVSCHPCQGYVTVKSGYALSPCGDDIVVCQDEAVNVCELIKKCREDAQRQWDCDPPWPRPAPDCGDQDEPWILYLCYSEQPSRGVTALRGASGGVCCSRCSCGGSSSCGCGCHAKTNGTTKNGCHTAPPKTLAQCEPTLTCEGYTFQLRKVPPLADKPPGALIARLTECLKGLAKIQQAAAGGANNFNEIKAALLEFLDRHAIYNCKLEQFIRELTPTLNPVTGAVAPPNIGPLLQELLRECFCSALLPPCPETVEENCVPIATVTLNCKDSCRVVRICNWEQRRIVVTFPNLEYWFEALLRQSGLAESLARYCCELQRRAPDFAAGAFAEVPGLVGSMLNQGQVDTQSIYKKLGEILKGLLSKLIGQ